MKNEVKKRDHLYYIFIGLILVSLTTIIEGFDIITLTINHITEDLTKDLLIHLYIAGFVLIIIGIYIYWKKSRLI